MTYTYTTSRTTTMTEARVRAVMRKVAANFCAFVAARHINETRAANWARDLTYMQTEEALDYFEVQVREPSGKEYGLRYTISADGTVVEDSSSGGLDVYGIPRGSKISLYAKPLPGQLEHIRDYLERNGWGFNGSSLDGETGASRSFSTGGYGITRQLVGDWS